MSSPMKLMKSRSIAKNNKRSLKVMGGNGSYGKALGGDAKKTELIMTPGTG